MPLRFAKIDRSWLGLLLVAAACGGKTELSDGDGLGFPMAPQTSPGTARGGATSGPQPTASGSAIITPIPVTFGGAPPTFSSICGRAAIDEPNGATFEGQLSNGDGALVFPTCSSSTESTQAALYVVSYGAGLVVDTFGSDFDTVLAIYDGICSNSELACDDDGAPGMARTSRLTIPETASKTVTIAVTGYGEAAGNFQLHIGDEQQCHAERVPNEPSAPIRGSTVGQPDRYASECSTRLSSPDRFYEFTPRLSGVYDIAITQSDFDPLLAVAEGSCQGKELLCIDDRAGNVNPSVGRYLTGGQPYTIVVDSYGGTSGTFTLSVTLSATDPGYCCAASVTRAACDRSNIADCVCRTWPDCCASAWNETCVLAASALGCGVDTRCGTLP